MKKFCWKNVIHFFITPLVKVQSDKEKISREIVAVEQQITTIFSGLAKRF